LFVGWVWLFVGAQESGAADVVAPLGNISNQVNGCLIFLNNSPYSFNGNKDIRRSTGFRKDGWPFTASRPQYEHLMFVTA